MDPEIYDEEHECCAHVDVLKSVIHNLDDMIKDKPTELCRTRTFFLTTFFYSIFQLSHVISTFAESWVLFFKTKSDNETRIRNSQIMKEQVNAIGE